MINKECSLKQKEFTVFLMQTSFEDKSWGKYSLLMTTSIPKSADSKGVGVEYPVCCYFKYRYGKIFDIEEWNNYLHVSDLKRNKAIETENLYDSAIKIIDFIHLHFPHTIVFLPSIFRHSGVSFLKFHYSYLRSELDKRGIYCIDNYENTFFIPDNVCIVVFSLIANRFFMYEKIPEIVRRFRGYSPSVMCIAIYREWGRDLRKHASSLLNDI